MFPNRHRKSDFSRHVPHSEADLPSPQWHRDILEVREARLAQGVERLTDWEEAKHRIREATS